MDLYDYNHHSGGSAEDSHKRQVSYNENQLNLGYDFKALKQQIKSDTQGCEEGGMSPDNEVPKPPKDGGFNFGSLEERMFVP